MKYTTLIRRLLQASSEAKYAQEDIAHILKERCVNGIDLIRMVLMNFVCDPRFKFHVSAFPRWNKVAQEFLEKFAERLMTTAQLNEDQAFFMMDEQLDEWLKLAFQQAIDNDLSRIVFEKTPNCEKRQSLNSLTNAINEFVGDEEEDNDDDEHQADDEEEESDKIIKEIEKNEEEKKEEEELEDEEEVEKEEGTRKPLLPKKAKENDKDQSNQSTNEDNDDNQDKEDKLQRGSGPGQQKQLENRFLENVPPSLIKLAKLIGRSGDDIMLTTSSFSTASKNDISGITIGNDLNCLLPTELALLSGKTTENLFYQRYVTRSLQLFSSNSHSQKGKKPHDGPIIICTDTSSSMDGEPVLVAKAITIAICIIAQRQKRKVLVIKYSDSHTLFPLHNITRQRKELMEFFQDAEMGGNNENSLFNWLFNDVMPQQGDYTTADILCISDFGWMPIYKNTMELIRQEKEKGMRFYGLNIGNKAFSPFFDDNTHEKMYYDPHDVCDELWEYSHGVCKKITIKA